MDLSINTNQIDASVALSAYTFYKAGKYQEAIPVLQTILDVEPQNWQARLFLAACFFKTNQPMAAERAFRFVYQSCNDQELKQKACFALQVVRASIDKPKEIPAEFGAMADRIGGPLPSIESIIN